MISKIIFKIFVVRQKTVAIHKPAEKFKSKNLKVIVNLHGKFKLNPWSVLKRLSYQEERQSTFCE
jgi:hypothetical protein